jgi:hypothetical protein
MVPVGRGRHGTSVIVGLTIAMTLIAFGIVR